MRREIGILSAINNKDVYLHSCFTAKLFWYSSLLKHHGRQRWWVRPQTKRQVPPREERLWPIPGERGPPQRWLEWPVRENYIHLRNEPLSDRVSCLQIGGKWSRDLLSIPSMRFFTSKAVSMFKVQGFFFRHILNYTGYNQKWNVNVLNIGGQKIRWKLLHI